MHMDNSWKNFSRLAGTVILFLALLLGSQAYPKHRRSIKEVYVGEQTQVDADDRDYWYPVENLNESKDPVASDSQMHGSQGKGDIIKATHPKHVDAVESDTWYPVENINESEDPESQAHPRQRRSIKEVDVGEQTHVDADDGDTWYPVENLNESEDPHPVASDSQIHGSPGETDMIIAIRDNFKKWGYALNEIPRPFGTMDPSKPIRADPEFIEILLALVDKLSPDLEKSIRDIVKLAKSQGGSQPSEDVPSTGNDHGPAHQDQFTYNDRRGEICEEAKDACLPEEMHKARWASDHPDIASGDMWDKTYKADRPTTKPTTTTQPTTTEISKVDQNLAEIEKLRKEHGWDKVTLDKDVHQIHDLLHDISRMITKGEDRPIKHEEVSKGQAEVQKIEDLLHEVEAMAEVRPPCQDTPGIPTKKEPLPENEQKILRELWKKQNIKVDETSAFQHHEHEHDLTPTQSPPAEQINVERILAQEYKSDQESAKSDHEMDKVNSLLSDLRPQEGHGQDHHRHLSEKEQLEAKAFSKIIQDIDRIAMMEAKRIEEHNQRDSKEKLDTLMEEIKMMQNPRPNIDHINHVEHPSKDFTQMDQVNRILQDLDRESSIERELQNKIVLPHSNDAEYDRVKEMHESLRPHSRDRERQWNGMNIAGGNRQLEEIENLKKQYGWDKEDSNYEENRAKVDEQLSQIQSMDRHYAENPVKSHESNRDQYAESDRLLAEQMKKVKTMEGHTTRDQNNQGQYEQDHQDEYDRKLAEQMNQVKTMQAHQPKKHYLKDQFAQSDRDLANTMSQVKAMEAHHNSRGHSNQEHGEQYHRIENDRALNDLMNSVGPATPHSRPSHINPFVESDHRMSQVEGQLEELKTLNAKYEAEKAEHLSNKAKVDDQLNQIKAMGSPGHKTISMKVHPGQADHHQRQVEEELRKISAMTQENSRGKSQTQTGRIPERDTAMDQINAIMSDLGQSRNEPQNMQKLKALDHNKLDLEALERMNTDQKVNDVLSALSGYPKYPDPDTHHGFPGNHGADDEMDRVNQQLAGLQSQHDRERYDDQMNDVNKLMAGMKPKARRMDKFNRADAAYLARLKNKRQRKNRF